jgi:ferredoxin
MDQYEISILETSETVRCSPGQSILDGIVTLGRKGIPTGCRGGGCGVCKVEILGGCYARRPMSRAITRAHRWPGRWKCCWHPNPRP